jgi:sulfur-carrier protein
MEPTAVPGSVLVRLPPLIATLFPDVERQMTLQAGSVRDVIRALDERWPGMWDCFCDSTPAVRRHINVFVGSRRGKLDDLLPPGAEVTILTAISGG